MSQIKNNFKFVTLDDIFLLRPFNFRTIYIKVQENANRKIIDKKKFCGYHIYIEVDFKIRRDSLLGKIIDYKDIIKIIIGIRRYFYK